MPKLVIKFDGVVIDQIVMKQGDMVIGRRPGSDILLDNLAVSGSHATIFTVGNDSFVQDLNSTNGTLVNNNKRISKHHLMNGDEIVIGKHSLGYVDENALRPQSDLAKTMIITPQKFEEMAASAAENAQAARAADKPVPVPASMRIGSIFVLSGANSGKRIDLVKSTTNLGRAGKMAGVIIRNSAGRYSLLPGGDGGTPMLNGKLVPGRGEELKNGDIIEVAGSRMQFYLK